MKLILTKNHNIRPTVLESYMYIHISHNTTHFSLITCFSDSVDEIVSFSAIEEKPRQ